jgi:hypothetical protein
MSDKSPAKGNQACDAPPNFDRVWFTHGSRDDNVMDGDWIVNPVVRGHKVVEAHGVGAMVKRIGDESLPTHGAQDSASNRQNQKSDHLSGRSHNGVVVRHYFVLKTLSSLFRRANSGGSRKKRQE